MTFNDDLDLSDRKDPRNWDTGNSTISQFLTYLRGTMDADIYDLFYQKWLDLPKGAALWSIHNLYDHRPGHVNTLEYLANNFYHKILHATELLSYVSNHRRKEGQVQEDLPASSGQTQGSTEDSR